MYRLRCTKKLLDRLPPTDPAQQENAIATNTRLGNWYATKLSTKPFLVLLVSERSLLSVVLEYAPLHTLQERFALRLREVLLTLGVDAALADKECAAMNQTIITKTESRQMLGSMNEFTLHAEWRYKDPDRCSLPQISAWLAEMPCKPIAYKSPDRLTKEIFSSGE